MEGGREEDLKRGEKIIKKMEGKIVNCGGEGEGKEEKIWKKMIIGI